MDILLAIREDGKLLTDALSQLSIDDASANFAAAERHEEVLGKLNGLLEDYAAQANSFNKAEMILSSLLFSAIEARRANIIAPESRTFEWILAGTEVQAGNDENSADNVGLRSDSSDGTDAGEGTDSDSGDDNDSVFSGIDEVRLFTDHALTSAELDRRAKASELFQTWLRLEHGLFYISGKVGSGKSTLMKFVAEHQKTKALLVEWARSQDRELIRANFFFWNAGTTLQKTHEGLLRSLLFQILNQCRAIIPYALPERWTSEKFSLSHLETQPWTLKDLSDAVTRVTEHAATVNSCFCFFIDGLDEYEGEHRYLIKDILRLCKSSFVKICVSSRPWNIFEHAFGKETQTWKLCLQDYTKSDIRRFIESQLMQDDSFKELVRPHSNTYTIVDRIEDRADGVFLWVVLVVRELHAEIDELGSYEELEDKLNDLPPDLDSFFKHIMDGIKKPYKKYMARLLLMCLRSEYNSFPLLFVHFLYENTRSGDALGHGICPISQEARNQCVKEASSKVNKWCRDLLKEDICYWLFPEEEVPAVSFSHRSVMDYIQQDLILQDLYSQAGLEFEPQLTTAALYLSYLRSLDDATAMSSKSAAYSNDRAPGNIPFFTMVAEYTLFECKGAQVTTGDAYCQSIVEEVDQVCIEIWARSGQRGSHWTSSSLPTREGAVSAARSTFLLFAIPRGPVWYAQDRIAELSDEDFRSQAPYLLLSSLCATHLFSWEIYLQSFGNLIIARQLVQRGADVNAYLEIIQHLWARSGPPNLMLRTNWEIFVEQMQNFLHETVWKGAYAEAACFFLEAGANIHCALPLSVETLGEWLLITYIKCEGSYEQKHVTLLQDTMNKHKLDIGRGFWQIDTMDGNAVEGDSWKELQRLLSHPST